MSEHLSNGQFASKEVSEGKPRRGKGRPFVKGDPRAGRPPGALGKVPRAVKEFLASLVDDSDVQDAVKGRILKGDAVAFFRALEHVVGKPQENVNVNLNFKQVEARLQAARKKRDGEPA